MKSGISAVILAYREADNLRVLLPELKKQLESTGEAFDIIIIDTHEPLDNTKEVCDDNGALYFNQPGKGFADAMRCGVEKAEREKFLILDGDGSHDPKYVPDIHEKFTQEDCDIVIGSRYIKGGRTEDKKSSVLMSRLLNFAFRTCIGIKAKDLSTDYRMYDTAQLKAVELTCENYDVLEEVLLKMKLNNSGLKIGETPIHFKKRVFGESKRRLWDFIKSYIVTLFTLFGMRMKANKEFFKNLVLYGLFGAIAAGVDYGLFSLLVGFADMDPVVANIAGAVCGFIFTFLTNTFLNFKKTTKIFKRLFQYGAICLIGMGISSGLLYLFEDSMNVFWLKLLVLIAVSLLQFFLNRRFTYGDERKKSGQFKAFVKKNAFYLFAAGIVLAMFVIMMLLASKRSFWMDDIFQIDMSWQDSLADMMRRILETDNNPPLSHLLTYVWIRVLPYGTVGLKLFNISLVSLGVYVCALAGKRIRGPRAGIFTALFCALSIPIVTLAAYTFRPYGLLFLLSALSVYILALYRQKGRSVKYFVLLTVCLTAMVYTHYFGALVIASMFFCDLIICLKKRTRVLSLLPYVISAVLFLPWFLLIREQSMDRLATMQPGMLTFSNFIDMINSLFGDTRLTKLYALAFLYLLIKSLVRKNTLSDDFGIMAAVVPVLCVVINILLVNYTPLKTYFWTRYHMGAIPMLMFSLGFAADGACNFICEYRPEKSRKLFNGIITGVFAVYALFNMYRYLEINQRGYLEPFEECADFIMEEEGVAFEDTIVFCTNYPSQRGMDYYLTHKGEREGIEMLWYELSMENLEGINRVYVLTLHRPLAQENTDMLLSEGFVLEYQNESLPISLYTREQS